MWCAALRVVAADSGGAILGEDMEPLQVVATVAVLVEPPYRTPSALLAERAFCPVEDGYSLLVRELELCARLLDDVGADVIHFDMSMRGTPLDQLSISDVARLPEAARKKMAKVLPKLIFLASRLRASKGIRALALGKESLPVRIAELSCAAHSLLFSAERALEEGREILLGLPVSCELYPSRGLVIARSLMPSEHDVLGYAEDRGCLLGSVEVVEIPNPVARRFRMVMIRPR